MEIFKKGFLYIVGAAAVAYEEAGKEIKKRRESIEKMLKSNKPKEAR